MHYHTHLPSSVATRFQVNELFLRLDVINNIENANSTVNTPKHVHHQSFVPAASHFLPHFYQTLQCLYLLIMLMLMKADRVSSPGIPYIAYTCSQ